MPQTVAGSKGGNLVRMMRGKEGTGAASNRILPKKGKIGNNCL